MDYDCSWVISTVNLRFSAEVFIQILKGSELAQYEICTYLLVFPAEVFPMTDNDSSSLLQSLPAVQLKKYYNCYIFFVIKILKILEIRVMKHGMIPGHDRYLLTCYLK